MDLHSDLWLDQPDAHDRVDARCATGQLSPSTAAQLHGFVDNGYMTLSLGLEQEFSDAFDAEIDELWKRRPVDLAVSPPGVGRPTSFRDYEGAVRERGYRIPDLHSHSARALDLYLCQKTFRFIELILDEPAIAFQSLYFEYGSSQGLHRDPMFVATRPPTHLLAAWIALEDVTPDSGPLAYVPGSHRLPWFEFEPGTIVCAKDLPHEKRQEFAAWRDRTMLEKEMSAQPFVCKRGDVFIWHGGLVHGGTKIENPARTRKSFVVHYSSAANYRTRTARVHEREDDGWRRIPRTTEVVLTRGEARGLDNPIHLH